MSHVPYLDNLRDQGIFAAFYDPDGQRYGTAHLPLPLGTRRPAHHPPAARQGLRPGGQDIAAQILWRHRKQRRVAYLYREDQAKPKRTPHPRSSRPSARPSGPGAPAPHAAPRSTTAYRAHKANATTAPRGGTDDTPAANALSLSTTSLTPNRRRRAVENDEYAAFLRRVIRAYSRRVAAGDIEAIADMTALADEIGTAIQDAITGLRSHRLQLGRHRAPPPHHPAGRTAALGLPTT